MLRYEGSPSSNSYDFGNPNDVREDEQSPFAKSFSSAGGSSLHTSASSSKAVLAALRSLQDKIRRLEIERSQALDDAAQLRNQLKNQDIEAEHSKERDAIQAKKSLHEARVSYEKILKDKEDMESTIISMEQRNSESQRKLSDLQQQVQSLERNKNESLLRLQDVESQISHYENQLNIAQQREKDLSNAMIWETKHHDEEIKSLKSEMQRLQQQLSQITLERNENQAKLIELDHLVGQLLNVNESLVNQLSARPAIRSARYIIDSTPSLASKTANSSEKGRSRSASKKTVPRVAMVGTASSDIRVEENARIKRPSSATRIRREEDELNAERLKGMHDMYVNIARNVIGDGSMAISRLDGKKSNGSNGLVTGPKKKDTAMKQRMEKTKSKKSSLKSNSLFDLNGFDQKYGLDSSHFTHDEPSAINLLSSNGLSSPKENGANNTTSSDLKAVIASLEEEFEALNIQYHTILSSSSEARRGGQDKGGDTSEQLVSVIQKLHRKGEQLRALKSPSKVE